MKKIYQTVIITVSCLLFIFSCKKSDSNTDKQEQENISVWKEFSASIGKGNDESYISSVKMGDAFYVLAATVNTKEKTNEYEDFKGGYRDILLSKFSNGNLVWTKCLGSEKSEQAIDIFEHNNELIIVANTYDEWRVAGSLTPANGTKDLTIYRVNSSGEAQKIVKDQPEHQDCFFVLYNGTEVFLVYREGDYFGDYKSIRFNLTNNTWGEVQDFVEQHDLYSVKTQKMTNGFMIMYRKSSDGYMIKLNNNFEKEWDKTFDMSQSIVAIQETGDGFLIAGRAKHPTIAMGDNRTPEIYLTKTDEQANKNGFEVGVGYLESGWFYEPYYQYGAGVPFFQIDAPTSCAQIEDTVYVFGYGTEHIDKPGVDGNGEVCSCNTFGMLMKLDLSQKSTHKNKFFKEVCFHKELLKDFYSIDGIIEFKNEFILIGKPSTTSTTSDPTKDIILRSYNK